MFNKLLFSDTSMTSSKRKGSEKSIFLKKHKSGHNVAKKCAETSLEEIEAAQNSNSSGFHFNFNIADEKSADDSAELKEEDLAAVEKFKFIKSDNTFRFNFS
jgi:5-deoxy-D-glucuronate isomerase